MAEPESSGGVVRSALTGTGLTAGQRVAVLLDHGGWQEVVTAAAARGPAVARRHDLRGRRRRSAEPADRPGPAALSLRTIAVAGDEAKRQFALRHGAHQAVLSDGWLAAVRAAVGERAVDIVLDPVGADRVTDSLYSQA